MSFDIHKLRSDPDTERSPARWASDTLPGAPAGASPRLTAAGKAWHRRAPDRAHVRPLGRTLPDAYTRPRHRAPSPICKESHKTMKSNLKPIHLLLGAAVVAVLVLVFREQQQAADAAGWEAYGQAERAGDTIESLRDAAQTAKDTSAEPWLAMRLSLALYEEGGASNLDQARTIAQQALERHADHAVAAHLSKLVAAIDSLRTAG